MIGCLQISLSFHLHPLARKRKPRLRQAHEQVQQRGIVWSTCTPISNCITRISYRFQQELHTRTCYWIPALNCGESVGVTPKTIPTSNIVDGIPSRKITILSPTAETSGYPRPPRLYNPPSVTDFGGGGWSQLCCSSCIRGHERRNTLSMHRFDSLAQLLSIDIRKSTTT
jgi:hypothetical protein